jgi:hypothetical protein
MTPPTVVDASFEPSWQSNYFINVTDSRCIWTARIRRAGFKGAIGYEIAGKRRHLECQGNTSRRCDGKAKGKQGLHTKKAKEPARN